MQLLLLSPCCWPLKTLSTSLWTPASAVRASKAHLPRWRPKAWTNDPLPPRLQHKRSPILKLLNMGGSVRVCCEVPTGAHDIQDFEGLLREWQCHVQTWCRSQMLPHPQHGAAYHENMSKLCTTEQLFGDAKDRSDTPAGWDKPSGEIDHVPCDIQQASRTLGPAFGLQLLLASLAMSQ